MPYNESLADRVREYLAAVPKLKIEEKKMFSGMAFLVNGKMCVNVSGDDLMVRFDPVLQEELEEKNGFQDMVMKGKKLKGYAYISPDAIRSNKEFDFWMKRCLEFNALAKSSRKKKPVKKVAKKVVAAKKVARKKVTGKRK